MIRPDALAAALATHLPQQRWFGEKDQGVAGVEVAEVQVLRRGWPGLVWAEAVVELDSPVGPDRARYQILVGLREPDDEPNFFEGKPAAPIGDLDTEQGPAHAYDAVIDPELSLDLFRIVAPGLDPPERVRPPGVEQSNTSLVYDERWIMKLFRRLYDEPNLDAETTQALAEVGFAHVAPPVAQWRRGTSDLAMVQPYLADAVEGWALALTSLRDLYAAWTFVPPDEQEGGPDPAKAGGDFAAEAERLGRVTAELHVALADAFGRHPADEGLWAFSIGARLARVDHPDLDRAAAERVLDRLQAIGDPGPAIRVHGDYHLGQVIRTDHGWYVLDFEGEPARPLWERRQPWSPFKDVAGMLRSFHYASMVALAERDERVLASAEAWEARNRQAFLEGYLPTAEEGNVLPRDPRAWSALVAAFELDKALYELAYERAHRPDWVAIPLHALRRLGRDEG